jgi:hypothetical protein
MGPSPRSPHPERPFERALTTPVRRHASDGKLPAAIKPTIYLRGYGEQPKSSPSTLQTLDSVTRFRTPRIGNPLVASRPVWRTTNERRKRISDRLPRGRTMLLQGRRAQLVVGCARPPRRSILCRRHSERGSEQSAKMGGIIETPPIGNLGYGRLGIRSV